MSLNFECDVESIYFTMLRLCYCYFEFKKIKKIKMFVKLFKNFWTFDYSSQ